MPHSPERKKKIFFFPIIYDKVNYQPSRHIVVVMFGRPCICCLLEKCFDHCVRSFQGNSGMKILLFNWMLNNGQLGEISSCV